MSAPHESSTQHDRPTPAEIDAIASRSFPTSFRGWDPDEVRVHLVKVAEIARALSQSQADLERRLAEAEAAARRADVSQLDPDEVAQILGEETARVLRTARESSDEIRSKAEERVALISRQAADDAARVRAEANDEAQALRTSAQEEADATRKAGEAYAEELRAEAEAELAARRTAFDEEVAAARQAGRDEAAQLAADAEDAAAAVRRTAEDESAAVRTDADAYASKHRTDADIYAERIIAEADEDVARRTDDLDAEIARRRAEADAELAESRAATERELAEQVAQAELQVAEAERVRERVLADLARKRKAARQHLEQLRAGRDRLLDAYELVRTTIDQATGELGVVLPDAKRLADEAARRVASEPEQSVAELEAELAMAREADLPILSPLPLESEGPEAGPPSDEESEAERSSVEEPGDDAPTLPSPPDEAPSDAAAVPEPTTAEATTSASTEPPVARGPVEEEEPRPGGAPKLHGRRSRRRGGDPLAGEKLPDVPLEPVEAGAAFEGVRVLSEPIDEPAAPTSEETDSTPPSAVQPVEDADVSTADAAPPTVPADPPTAAPAPPTVPADAKAGPTDVAADDATPPDEPASRGAAEARPDPPKSDPELVTRGSAAEAALAAVGKGAAPDEKPDQPTSADRDPDVAGIFERIRKDHEDDGSDAKADQGPDQPVAEPLSAADARLAELFERRDAAVDEVGRRVAKRMKRQLSDHQSTLLDELRRARKQPAVDEVLGDPDTMLADAREAVAGDLAGASAAGVALAGDLDDRAVEHPEVALDEVAAEVIRAIAEPLRARLARALGEGDPGDDEDDQQDPVDELELADRIRACYREWRGPRLTVAVTDACATAFGLGLRAGLPDEVGLRWFTDRGDKPCPDCDDNRLAGIVAAGERFPTGQLVPPAHQGCRCLALPPAEDLPAE